MAVREGFEPSIRDKPYTPLAGERLQPLGHLTVLRRHILRFTENMSNTFFEKIHETDLTVADLIKVTIKRTLPLYYDEKRESSLKKRHLFSNNFLVFDSTILTDSQPHSTQWFPQIFKNIKD